MLVASALLLIITFAHAEYYYGKEDGSDEQNYPYKFTEFDKQESVTPVTTGADDVTRIGPSIPKTTEEVSDVTVRGMRPTVSLRTLNHQELADIKDALKLLMKNHGAKDKLFSATDATSDAARPTVSDMIKTSVSDNIGTTDWPNLFVDVLLPVLHNIETTNRDAAESPTRSSSLLKATRKLETKTLAPTRYSLPSDVTQWLRINLGLNTNNTDDGRPTEHINEDVASNKTSDDYDDDDDQLTEEPSADLTLNYKSPDDATGANYDLLLKARREDGGDFMTKLPSFLRDGNALRQEVNATTTIPTTPPLITTIPTTPPLITTIPTTPPLITAIPTTPPLITAIPTTPPLITAIPTTPPLITAIPTTPLLTTTIPTTKSTLSDITTTQSMPTTTKYRSTTTMPPTTKFTSLDLTTTQPMPTTTKPTTTTTPPSTTKSTEATTTASSRSRRRKTKTKKKKRPKSPRVFTYSTTTTRSRRKKTRYRSTTELSIPRLMELITNLTMDYSQNLTDLVNKTLQGVSDFPCPIASTTTEVPTTVPTTTADPYGNLTGTIMAKCFVCGIFEPAMPRHARCADSFAGDFIPLVPVEATARKMLASYRKYCRWMNVPKYIINETDSRSMWGRWTGGCSVRWIDLSGVYTQRTCRNRHRAVMGNHWLSKRMAKLEMALQRVDNACIISPMASLVPLSRGVSLYARFHACVCTGSWCNRASPSPQCMLHVVAGLITSLLYMLFIS